MTRICASTCSPTAKEALVGKPAAEPRGGNTTACESDRDTQRLMKSEQLVVDARGDSVRSLHRRGRRTRRHLTLVCHERLRHQDRQAPLCPPGGIEGKGSRVRPRALAPSRGRRLRAEVASTQRAHSGCKRDRVCWGGGGGEPGPAT